MVPLSYFVEIWLQSPWENGISDKVASVSEFIISKVVWCMAVCCLYHCYQEELFYFFLLLISDVALWLTGYPAWHRDSRSWVKRPLDRASHGWQVSEARVRKVMNCYGREPPSVRGSLLHQHGLVYPDRYIHLWRKGKRVCLQNRSLWIP